MSPRLILVRVVWVSLLLVTLRLCLVAWIAAAAGRLSLCFVCYVRISWLSWWANRLVWWGVSLARSGPLPGSGLPVADSPFSVCPLGVVAVVGALTIGRALDRVHCLVSYAFAKGAADATIGHRWPTLVSLVVSNIATSEPGQPVQS